MSYPPPGIGIKAKHCRRAHGFFAGVSAPRNWNQGKATENTQSVTSTSIRPPELESRQSSPVRFRLFYGEYPPPGIGIKAKQAV